MLLVFFPAKLCTTIKLYNFYYDLVANFGLASHLLTHFMTCTHAHTHTFRDISLPAFGEYCILHIWSPNKFYKCL